MPRIITYSCSVCGTTKGESNHWFVHLTSKPGFQLNTWKWAEEKHQLDKGGIEFVCGHQCVHKLLDAYMQGSMETDSLTTGG